MFKDNDIVFDSDLLFEIIFLVIQVNVWHFYI